MSTEIKEDYLEVDQNIPGQNYVCLSFVSPEKLLKNKEVFFSTSFLKDLFSNDDLITKELRNKLMNKEIEINYESISKLYEDWKFTRNDDLEREYFEQNDFKTSMRGLKVRGVYDSYKEASVRAQLLRRRDPSFNVFIGQVGYWLPWDPDCESVPEQEYQEGVLNDLVKKYKENLDSRDAFYDQVKNEKIEKANKELNAKKELIKANKEQNEKETTSEEDIKNIDTLRSIVDESSKIFYDNLKNNSTQEATETSEPTQVESNPLIESLEKEDPWMARKNEV